MSSKRYRKIKKDKVDILVTLIEDNMTTKQIAKKFKVTVQAIYYRLRKKKIDIRKLRRKVKARLLREKKKELKIERANRRGKSYHHYINTAYKKGEITLKEKIRILRKYYKNRSNPYLTSTVDQSVMDAIDEKLYYSEYN